MWTTHKKITHQMMAAAAVMVFLVCLAAAQMEGELEALDQQAAAAVGEGDIPETRMIDSRIHTGRLRRYTRNRFNQFSIADHLSLTVATHCLMDANDEAEFTNMAVQRYNFGSQFCNDALKWLVIEKFGEDRYEKMMRGQCSVIKDPTLKETVALVHRIKKNPKLSYYQRFPINGFRK